jgi:hypothetical protein
MRCILRVAADQELPPVSSALGTRISQRFAGLGLTADFPELREEARTPADLGGGDPRAKEGG